MTEKKVLIGIIETNNYSVSDCIPQKNTYEDLYDHILDIVEFKSVPESKVMDEIMEQTGMIKHKNLTGDTTKIYEDDKIIIDMCYAYDNPDDDINYLAHFAKDGICGIINSNDTIKGNVVCMKSHVNEHGKCVADNISLSDIVSAVHKKIVKRAVIVNPPNEIIHYEYVIDPVEMLTHEEKDNYKYFDFPLLGNSIKIFVEIKPTIDKVNDICSAIFNKNYAMGRCIITMSNDKGMFIDIDKETEMITKIIRILSDKSQKRTLDEQKNEDVDSYIKNNEKIINNFGRLLTNRANSSKIDHKLSNILSEMSMDAHSEPTVNELIKKQIDTNSTVGPNTLETKITNDEIVNKLNELKI